MKFKPVLLAFAFAATAFGKDKPPTAQIKLSISETVALQALEKQKQEATQQYQQAIQAELAIEQEFAEAHPGWHLNQQTFAPELTKK